MDRQSNTRGKQVTAGWYRIAVASTLTGIQQSSDSCDRSLLFTCDAHSWGGVVLPLRLLPSSDVVVVRVYIHVMIQRFGRVVNTSCEERPGAKSSRVISYSGPLRSLIFHMEATKIYSFFFNLSLQRNLWTERLLFRRIFYGLSVHMCGNLCSHWM